MDLRKLILSALLFFPCALQATVTHTPLLNLCKPGENEYDWLDCINGNFDILDVAGAQTNASAMTTGTLDPARVSPSTFTLYGPVIPAAALGSGTLPAGTSVQSYVDGSIKGPAIASSTIPINALNPSGCAEGQTMNLSSGKWSCADMLATSEVATWQKFTFTFDQFAKADVSSSVYVTSLPAKTILHSVVVKHSVSFIGGAIDYYAVSIGSGTAYDSIATYSDEFNMNTSVRADNMATYSGAASESTTGSWPVYITARSYPDNLDQATQGSLDLWLYTSSLP